MAKLSTLQNQYLALAPGASRLKVALTEQLKHILATHQISLGVPLESRVKAWSSIAEKIERKARRLTSVDELDDLVGIRLILLFQRDVDLIHRLIGETFLVLSAEDTASRALDSIYLSLNWIGCLNPLLHPLAKYLGNNIRDNRTVPPAISH